MPITACVELGFPGAKRPTHSSQFGYGLEKIWMDNMHCYGTEDTLSDCRYDLIYIRYIGMNNLGKTRTLDKL